MAGSPSAAPGEGARPLRVLGIDPGLANLGFGVVEEVRREPRLLGSAWVRTSPKEEQSERLLRLRGALVEFLTLHRPDVIAMEAQYLRRQPQTSYRVGQAVGVVLLTAAEHRLPVFEYGPEQVKRSLVGTGRADKEQVTYMVRAILKLTATPDSNHVADALALALTHLQSRRLGGLMPG